MPAGHTRGPRWNAVSISGPAELRAAALRSVADWHYSSEMDLPAKVHAIITFKSHGPSGKRSHRARRRCASRGF